MYLRTPTENPTLRITLKAVKTCSKAYSAYSLGYGKSPCFSQVTFLQLVSPDWLVSKFCYVDDADFLECTL
jgi:hypothetical protein